VLGAEYKGLKLTRNQIQVLLQMRVLPYPVHIEGNLRLLLLNTQGDLVDIEQPSAERQKSTPANDRPAKKKGSKSGG
jgi:hypothetical protein